MNDPDPHPTTLSHFRYEEHVSVGGLAYHKIKIQFGGGTSQQSLHAFSNFFRQGPTWTTCSHGTRFLP